MKYITFENLNSFATKLADKITEKFAKKTDIPTSLPANGGNAATVNGHTVASNVPANAVFTDTKAWASITGKPSTFPPETHQHGNGDITGLDAGKITSGTIDIARLPAGALERCVVVADDTARLALTKTSVQTGDTVKVTATGKMYFVVDDTKLNTEAGYEIYTAGTATAVPWSGVTGKPSTFPPSSHTHTKSQISDFPTSMPASDVPAWAKASAKPTYTPSEVGVIGTTPTNGQVAVFDGATGKIKSTGYTILSSVPSGAKFTDTVYSHPTTSGNKHIPSGGSSGQFLKWSADGTAVWAADNNTTYSNMTAATASAAGKAGLVPAPAAGAQAKYLRGDGTWAEIPAAEAATEADIDDIIAGVFS